MHEEFNIKVGCTHDSWVMQSFRYATPTKPGNHEGGNRLLAGSIGEIGARGQFREIFQDTINPDQHRIQYATNEEERVMNFSQNRLFSDTMI